MFDVLMVLYIPAHGNHLKNYDTSTRRRSHAQVTLPKANGTIRGCSYAAISAPYAAYTQHSAVHAVAVYATHVVAVDLVHDRARILSLL